MSQKSIKLLVITFCLLIGVFINKTFSKPLKPTKPKTSLPNVLKLIQGADLARFPEGDISCTVNVRDYQGKELLRENVYQVFSKGSDESLVQTISPERLKGRKLLMKEDDLWLYTPDTKRPTRVSLQQKLTGEVANGDLSRTRFAKDYKVGLVQEEKNQPQYFLELLANSKSTTYQRVELWISKTDYLPVKAKFFTESGKLLKTGEYSEPKIVLGKKRITRLEIKDALDPSRRSELVYSEVKKEKLDSSMFNKDRLSQ